MSYAVAQISKFEDPELSRRKCPPSLRTQYFKKRFRFSSQSSLPQTERRPKRKSSWPSLSTSGPPRPSKTKLVPLPPSSGLGVFAMLPNELIVKIFSHLTLKDLGNLQRVCTVWRTLAKDSTLWKNTIISKNISVSFLDSPFSSNGANAIYPTYSPYVREYRIVVLGADESGKVELTEKFLHGPNYVEWTGMKRMIIDGTESILDVMYITNSQEEFSALLDQYMKTGQGFLIVYSVNSARTFEAVLKYRNQVKRIKEDYHDIPIVIVGNNNNRKKERQVTLEEGTRLAEALECDFVEVNICGTAESSRTQLDETFALLVRKIQRWREINNPPDLNYHSTRKNNCVVS